MIKHVAQDTLLGVYWGHC